VWFRFNAPHRTALHCTALHCTALHCTVLYCTALFCTVLYCTILHCTLLYYTVLYRIALYSAALHCIALYCGALYRHARAEKVLRRKEFVVTFAQHYLSRFPYGMDQHRQCGDYDARLDWIVRKTLELSNVEKHSKLLIHFGTQKMKKYPSISKPLESPVKRSFSDILWRACAISPRREIIREIEFPFSSGSCNITRHSVCLPLREKERGR